MKKFFLFGCTLLFTMTAWSDNIAFKFPPTENPNTPRDTTVPPTAIYEGDTVTVEFTDDEGMVVVEIIALQNGSCSMEMGNSAMGAMTIYLPEGHGRHEIVIETETGNRYSGTFTR